MGLVIHSLDMLSPQANRDYYIYLLDYGWDEPLSKVIRDNFYKLSGLACKTQSAFIIGTGEDLGHFDDEVFSWHKINGEDATELLPAILITTVNPHEFKDRSRSSYAGSGDKERFNIVLIPLRNFCEKTTDVMPLITSIFKDIQEKKELKNFQLSRERKQGVGKAIINSIILEPKICGCGFSFNKLKDFLGRPETKTLQNPF